MRLDNQTFVYCAASCGEDAFYTMEKLICSEGFRMMVVDSVSALLPRAELEGDVGNPQVQMHCWHFVVCSLSENQEFMPAENSK